MRQGTLYAVVDPSRCDGFDEVEEFIRRIIDGGATWIQLRDKEATGRQLVDRARRLAGICTAQGAQFIVNDRLDVALAAGADGVHLGPDDVPVEAARTVVDGDFVVGGSAGTPEAATRLQNEGADYLGVGAIYEARSSKSDASPPRGPEAIEAVVDAVDVPVVGIGGIDASNAKQVVEHGAAGVAVISALMDADDPEAAAAALHRTMAR